MYRLYQHISIYRDIDMKHVLHPVFISLWSRSLRLYSIDPGSSTDEVTCFHISKGCFQLEDALASGFSRGSNIG